MLHFWLFGTILHLNTEKQNFTTENNTRKPESLSK